MPADLPSCRLLNCLRRAVSYPMPFVCAFAVCVTAAMLNPIFADEREEFFERQIRPLFADHCVSCHGAAKQEGELRLDSRKQVLEGTADASALVNVKDVAASRLLQVLLYSADDVQMPPKAKLGDEQIHAVRHWIESGAYWPENHSFGKAAAFDPNAWRHHWAFQPVSDPPMPAVFQEGWHPVDAFIREKLQEQGIAESPPADLRTLTRRVAYAVTGLPPSPGDLNAAAAISDPQAGRQWLTSYLDRQLASPHFGERWGRYWLDISRYADTKGYVFQEDREYKDAWKFREWVIRSLNDDMPYDEFLKRQLAADQLPGSDDPAQLAAMGFLTLGRRFLNNQQDIFDDRIDVLSRGTMALTVTCARCHDHKFDPIPSADYYSLYGIFDSSEEPKNDPSPLRLVDREKPREPVIFIRGSAGNRGPRVTRHFLTALSPGEPEAFSKGSGRLELAEKIASPENPLTARVAVNRIWLRLFGQGLVDSPSDFGVRTPPPTHPELLDHLATYFVSHNWSQKALIRYLIRSWTWQQSSAARPDTEHQDSENRLLCRMNRRRLDFEAFRDSLLSVSGQLDETVGGPSVDITSEPFTNRRTVYARIDRQNLPGLFRTFDFANPDSHSAKRFETTIPQQALHQLNHRFVQQQAQKTIQQAGWNSQMPTTALVSRLYQTILKREPTRAEIESCEQFLVAAELLAPSEPISTGWHYGWGAVNEERSQVADFRIFPVFHEGRWSGGKELPDSRLGYCLLNRDGGHPGNDLKMCCVRRWVADRACEVRVTGNLRHPAEQGDGVTALVIANGKNLARISVHHGQKPVRTETVSLQAGDTVDLITECNANSSHDTFEWKATLVQMDGGQTIREWKTSDDFSGSAPQSLLTPQEQLAQALLLTNEFMFVD
ncbi:MAG: PSD1 and planctomycete cytochrome C domain-containing protein [Planctomycetaceae bacterium]